MFCTKCGSKVENDATFCSNCGNVITRSETTENQTNNKPKKSRNKMALIVSVCVVALILVVSVVMVIAKKTDNVTRIIKAYENTMNAENYDVNVTSASFGLGTPYVYEVFGKGELKDVYIATFECDSDDWLDCIDEEYLWRGIHGDVYYNKHDFQDGAEGWCAYDEYQWIAERDVASLWNQELGDDIGLSYDEAYDLAVDVVLDYIKNQDASAIENMKIEDDIYSMSLDINDFAEDTEYHDTVERIISMINESNDIVAENLEIKVILDGKYLKSISTAVDFDNKKEMTIFSLEFANVNELTKESSVAYKLFNTDEYIDPTASMSEEEKNAYVVKSEVLPAYENYANDYVSDYSFSFIYLDDEIPELVLHGDCEAAGNIICTYYNGSVVELNTQRLNFDYLEKQRLLCNSTGNMGYYFDNIFNLKDGEFTNVASGEYREAYDDNGNIVTDANGIIVFSYFWNGQQVTADEYDELLAQAFNKESTTSVYDLEFYSSVVEAYDNIVL